ncbi:MAG: VCBS repeat-containing protein [Ignavibacteriaceae bacterium]|nr:VCBS repeat-containing protein [Ignavibacteriaceae bacterium]
MKKMLLAAALIFVWSASLLSQPVGVKTAFNLANLTGADSVRPYSNDKGMRSVWFAGDLDKDGKKELVTTDYTNGGRVHVFEFANANTLELVWSSPTRPVGTSSGSTPRWVRTGDLDGDGNMEIVFPLSTGTADFEVQVFEHSGADNDYGTVPAFTLANNYFAAQGLGNFRTNREVAMVYDFDGDGSDELIMSNRNHGVYVLGVFGTFPGFAGWTLEGGDPTVVPGNSNTFSVSHWHSIPANLDGAGRKEIVNIHWNFWGMWSIKPLGTDSYQYPDPTIPGFYKEMFRYTLGDHVPYMGIQAVDVDGDGSDEIAGILYGGTTMNYALALSDFGPADSTVYIWDSTKTAIISSSAWTAAGLDVGSFWGIGAADLNGNGKTEILLGGGNGFNVMAVEYKGTGSLLDSNSYTNTLYYTGRTPYQWNSIAIYDSAGTIDTIGTESPFISKMTGTFDSDNNGRIEIAASYQSVYDSMLVKKYTWNSGTSVYVLTDSFKVKNAEVLSVRVFESTITGLEEKELSWITPDDFNLEQNYPNPFNPSTTLRFTVPVDKQISIAIYDVLGNKVKTLVNNEMVAKGAYEVTWDGTSNSGSKVASGTYIAEMRFGNFMKSVKMSLLK